MIIKLVGGPFNGGEFEFEDGDPIHVICMAEDESESHAWYFFKKITKSTIELKYTGHDGAHLMECYHD